MNDEPITADALSLEPGWVQPAPDISPGWYVIDGAGGLKQVGVGTGKSTWQGVRVFAVRDEQSLVVPMPHITTMPQLRALVAALRGEADPRIDALDEACEQMSHERDTARAQAAYWRWMAYAGHPLHEPVLSVGRATWTGTSFSVYVNRRYHVCRRRAQRYAWAVKS